MACNNELLKNNVVFTKNIKWSSDNKKVDLLHIQNFCMQLVVLCHMKLVT